MPDRVRHDGVAGVLAGREIDQRAAVVKEACGWIGTPYRHQAAVKGAGVDCGMLLALVYADAGVFERVDPREGAGYTNDWMLHRGEEKYAEWCRRFGREVETPLFGDAALFQHGRTYSHGAIVVSWPVVIHAEANAGCVVMEDVSKSPHGVAKRMFFSPW